MENYGIIEIKIYFTSNIVISYIYILAHVELAWKFLYI